MPPILLALQHGQRANMGSLLRSRQEGIQISKSDADGVGDPDVAEFATFTQPIHRDGADSEAFGYLADCQERGGGGQTHDRRPAPGPSLRGSRGGPVTSRPTASRPW